MRFDFEKEKLKKSSASFPLSVDEVIECMNRRWGVTYDLRVLVKENKIYFQVMWAYLEQQSFPMNQEQYKNHLNQILEIINRCGQSEYVRYWLETINARPRLGRAITLPLMTDERLNEFLLGD